MSSAADDSAQTKGRNPIFAVFLGMRCRGWSENRKPWTVRHGYRKETWPLDLDGGFSNKSFKHWRLDFENIRPKALDVKFDGRLDISNRRLASVAFSHHDTLDAEWVGHIAVRVLLDNDSDLPHRKHLLA